MKLSCQKDSLRNALLQAERVVGKNLALPILGNILLSAQKEWLVLRATNLEIGIEIKIPAKVEKDGMVVIPPGVLSGILSSSYDVKISLELSGTNLEITTANAKSVVKCVPSDDFPTLPIISDGNSFSIQAEKLSEGIKSVWYSASSSDIKPEIASIYVYPEGEEIVFVATDSFRLAEKKVSIKKNIAFPSILIPQKNVIEMLRVIEGVSGEVNVVFTKNQISLSFSGVYFTSRIVDGVFPDYRQIIPKDKVSEVVVLKQDILNGLKVTNLFSDKFNRVDLSVDVEKKKLTIESKNLNIGENKTDIDATLTGKSIKLGFNQKYIMDCFQSLKQDSIVLRFFGEGRPLVVSGLGDNSFTYLIMPLTS